MAQFFDFGDAFVQSENRLSSSRRNAIERVASDTGFAPNGGNVSGNFVGGATNLSKQNEVLRDFLQFTAQQSGGGGAVGGVGTARGAVGRPSGGGGGAPRLSGPSRLLQSSGTVSRRFNTGFAGAGTGVSAGGSGDPNEFIQASQSKSDIQPVLEDLLAQLVSDGGTPQSQQNSATRQAASAELLSTIQQLTPANAEARAIAAVDLVVQRALEGALPQLQASGESAGTATNALQTLAINDLATRTAGTTAAVILESITNFAQAQAQAGGSLQGLTEVDPVSRELISLITGTPTESSNVSAGGSQDVLEALGIQFNTEGDSPFSALFNSGPGPVAPATGGGGPTRLTR